MDNLICNFQKMDNANSLYCCDKLVPTTSMKMKAVESLHDPMDHLVESNIQKNGGGIKFANGSKHGKGTLNDLTLQHSVIFNGTHLRKHQIVNGTHADSAHLVNKHVQNGTKVNGEQVLNGSSANLKHASNHINGKYTDNFSNNEMVLETNRDHIDQGSVINNDQRPETNGNSRIDQHLPDSSHNLKNSKQNPVVVTDQLTAADLQDLFEDKICVLHVPHYVPQVVCEKLDTFLREQGSDQYTHEVRKDGRADLLYFGVNRYGFPLNSTYNDATGESLERYFAEALSNIRSIRRAAEPYLSPIDKLRVELDETWHKKVNVATLNGQKTFCGIGRIMPPSLSELSADQPHFDAVPTSYFPEIFKQFAANIYLNVPDEGGELEIWNVDPVDVENVEGFAIPKDWRAKLPGSIRVKPGPGDLLLLNTRRPHAITKFAGDRPRTSVQSFIGLTKTSEVFLWV